MTVELSADCARCFGLCCVVPAFARSVDFAIDKPAATPCPNLREDFGCGIHAELRPRGMPGCTAYDCFGAGQQVSQVTFEGVDWRSAPTTAAQMYAVFPVMRELHEFLWYLRESASLVTDGPVQGEVLALTREVEALTAAPPDTVSGADLPGLRGRVGDLLGRVSSTARGGAMGPDLSGDDLVGLDLRGRDLRGSSLRGALLLGADLRGADLARADLLGADLRGARVAGADLRGAIFLTQQQVGGCAGDATTVLPRRLTRPDHWS